MYGVVDFIKLLQNSSHYRMQGYIARSMNYRAELITMPIWFVGQAERLSNLVKLVSMETLTVLL